MYLTILVIQSRPTHNVLFSKHVITINKSVGLHLPGVYLSKCAFLQYLSTFHIPVMFTKLELKTANEIYFSVVIIFVLECFFLPKAAGFIYIINVIARL